MFEKIMTALVVIFIALLILVAQYLEHLKYQEENPTVNENLTNEVRSSGRYQELYALFKAEAKRCGGGRNNGDNMDHCYFQHIIHDRDRYLEEQRCIPWGRWYMNNRGETHDNLECRQE